MPVLTRRALRHILGRDYLHDTLVGTTTGSWGTQAGSYNIVDSKLADPTASGEELYSRHYLRLIAGVGVIQDLRVGSFNCGSGAFLGAQTLATTIASGSLFEVHGLVPPGEKDRALDGAIQQVRIQQELTIWAVDSNHIYSLGPEVLDVLDARYFSDPTSSLDRGEHRLAWWKLEQTASGQSLRIEPSLIQSYQLVMDAVMTVSLGGGDLATVNLLSPEQVLWGATARCYWLLAEGAPGKESDTYKKRQLEAAKEARRLADRFLLRSTRKIQLDEWV